MSTTFGIKIAEQEEPIELALRYGRAGRRVNIQWLNSLAKYLPSNTVVHPLDNSAQGVQTIEDLLKLEKDGTLDLTQ